MATATHEYEKGTTERISVENEKVNAVDANGLGLGDEPDWTQSEETALRHKLDWYIVPLVTLLYLLCFLDRQVLFDILPLEHY